jgi:hypothetical protein
VHEFGEECLGGFSSDHTRFFEAEITWPTVERLTDNNVIEHVDLQNPGSFE